MYASVNYCHTKMSAGDARQRPTNLCSGINIEGVCSARTTGLSLPTMPIMSFILLQMQTEESMSTCRFAQRVSTIKNDARINEDVDPGVLIRRLRSDCAALNDEVAFLKVWRCLQ